MNDIIVNNNNTYFIKLLRIDIINTNYILEK